MPSPSITSIAFVGPLDIGGGRADPEATLALVAHAERLGFDGAWFRPAPAGGAAASASPTLAAASQRTSRIRLGATVRPLELGQPERLTADLRTADAFARGRVHLEVGGRRPRRRPADDDDLDDPAGAEPFALIDPLVERLRSEPDSGLSERLWFGGDDIRSATTAGRKGLHLFAGSSASAPGATSFRSAQRTLVATWRAAGRGRSDRSAAVGRVILPTDSAGRTARARFRDFGGSWSERHRSGPDQRSTWFAPDLIGPGSRILDELAADPLVNEARELRLELPDGFPLDDHRRILEDFVAHVAPGLGWAAPRPAAG